MTTKKPKVEKEFGGSEIQKINSFEQLDSIKVELTPKPYNDIDKQGT
jgi:hypothetical protein